MTDRATPSAATAPWWAQHRHADRRPFLMTRNRVRAAVRRSFEDQGFIEVETAHLQSSPGNEAHLHAFATEILDVGGGARPLYLHTSPEFACKSLLAAGETKIFSLSKVFRNRERGPLHHPEFTMLEWYRAGGTVQDLMADCAHLLALAAETAGTTRINWRGVSLDPSAEPERLGVIEAFERYAGLDLAATLGPDGETDRDHLARQVRAKGGRVSDDDTWADLFSKVLATEIEPKLGQGRATFLCDYPAAEAALARRKPGDARLAERFELYACGVELANAFGELTDPDEQRRRFAAEMDEKARVYGERYPIDEDFLAALAHMPPAAGAALGFDRLVMLAAGARRIEDVLWTPVP